MALALSITKLAPLRKILTSRALATTMTSATSPPEIHKSTPPAPPSTSTFAYTYALVRGLPASFEEGLKLAPPPTPINVSLASKQHDAYTALLRQLVPN